MSYGVIDKPNVNLQNELLHLWACHGQYATCNMQTYHQIFDSGNNCILFSGKKRGVNDGVSYLLTEIQKNRSGNLVLITSAAKAIHECQEGNFYYREIYLTKETYFPLWNSIWANSQKLGRCASRRVHSAWKSLGRVSFGSKKFGSKILRKLKKN